MNLRVYLYGTHTAVGAEHQTPTNAASPSDAASALVLREGLCDTATVIVVPADVAAQGAFTWGTAMCEPAHAQTCARFEVTAAGVATQVFPAP